MYTWFVLAIISGIILGFWDIVKKKAFEKNSIITVLAFYSLFCFVLVSFEFNNAIKMSSSQILIVLIKTFVIFLAWMFSFSAIKNLPISVITPFDTINPLFSIIFGIAILNEKLVLFQYIGIGIMLISYYFIGRVGTKEVFNIFRNKYFYFMIASAILNAVSATIDKVALRQINPGQLQFWFSLFMTILYMVVLVVIRIAKIDKTRIKLDYMIPLMSIILIITDRLYFTAVNIPAGQISLIMPLRKVSIIVSAIIGGILFKEKNLKKKFWCICLLLIGIVFLFVGK